MNAKRWLLIAGLAAVALLQLGAPLAQIAKYEATIAFGSEYKFKTAPVDPADVLRGRYVALDFLAARDAEGKYGKRDVFSVRGQRLWVSVSKDAAGFAKVDGVETSKPSAGDSFQAVWNWRLQFPFDQYFMNEWKAPKVESAYWSANRRPGPGGAAVERIPSYATVRIWHGATVLTGLYIDGKPVGSVAQ